MIDLPFKAIPF